MFLAVLVTALALWGQPAPSAPSFQKWAVVIGISDYQHPGIPDIKYAAEDARAIRRFLVDDAGFAADHVVVPVNEQAS